jgi:protein O-GlcNAc transferase
MSKKQQPIPQPRKAKAVKSTSAQPGLFPVEAGQPREKTVLHVGCGQKSKKDLPAIFHGEDWKEIRLDIQPSVKPDIVADIMDMKPVVTNSVDAVFSSHNIEHVYAYQVQQVLSEFYRVIRPGGLVVITCPDIQHVAFHVALGKLEQKLYDSPAGEITPQDILYGHTKSLAKGEHYMAHKTAFTAETLGRRMAAAGFRNIVVERDNAWNLWARGNKFAAEDPRSKADAKVTMKGQYPFMVVPLPEISKGLMPDELDQPPKLWKKLELCTAQKA